MVNLTASSLKARAMAEWLISRRANSLGDAPDDPRFGIPPGNDEGDDFKHFYMHQNPPVHWYPSLVEAYRAFAELGEVWVKIGGGRARWPDVGFI